jgi:hypothetical protein
VSCRNESIFSKFSSHFLFLPLPLNFSMMFNLFFPFCFPCCCEQESRTCF